MRYLKLFEAFDESDEGVDDPMSWTKYFEILSIKYSVGGDDFRLIEPGHPEFDDCVQDCVESEFRKDEIEIYSVRRKEDGEVFTIGQPVYNVSFDIKNFGVVDKLWPSFFQMRADIGRGGFPLNHLFFMSSTIVDLKNKGINKYYAMDINESHASDSYEINQVQFYDLIKRYQSLTPTQGEFEAIKSEAEKLELGTVVFDDLNTAGTRSISILSNYQHIIIWKLEDEWWAVYNSWPMNNEAHFKCDQLSEVLDLLKHLD